MLYIFMYSGDMNLLRVSNNIKKLLVSILYSDFLMRMVSKLSLKVKLY